jgi:uncharacterized damage-inducible protein DinB
MTTIDTESRDKLIDALVEYPAQLHELIAGADDDELTRAGPEGSWGVVEVLCHLRDWERIYVRRIQRMIEEDDPTFETIDDSLWPIDRDYHAQNPREVLENFAEHRSKLVNLLEDLSVSDWALEGHAPRQGRVTIGWYAEHIRDHDIEHLKQIRQALRVERVSDNEE